LSDGWKKEIYRDIRFFHEAIVIVSELKCINFYWIVYNSNVMIASHEMYMCVKCAIKSKRKPHEPSSVGYGWINGEQFSCTQSQQIRSAPTNGRRRHLTATIRV